MLQTVERSRPGCVRSRCLRRVAICSAAAFAYFPQLAFAGGPKFVAGTSYFDPGVVGQPVHWAGK